MSDKSGIPNLGFIFGYFGIKFGFCFVGYLGLNLGFVVRYF